MMEDGVTSTPDEKQICNKPGKDDKPFVTSTSADEDINGNHNEASTPDAPPLSTDSNDIAEVNDIDCKRDSKALDSAPDDSLEDLEAVEQIVDSSLSESDIIFESIRDSKDFEDFAEDLGEKVAEHVALDKDAVETSKQAHSDVNNTTNVNVIRADIPEINGNILDCQNESSVEVNNYNHSNIFKDKCSLTPATQGSVILENNEERPRNEISYACEEDLEVAEILGNTEGDKDVQVKLDNTITITDVVQTLTEINKVIETAKTPSPLSSEPQDAGESLKADQEISETAQEISKSGLGDFESKSASEKCDSDGDVLQTLAEIDDIIDFAEKAYVLSESQSQENLNLETSSAAAQENTDVANSLYSAGYSSDGEVEMGRRRLSFKRKQQHMVYTEDEFREQYTDLERGKSLDSAAQQDIKRGFQRLKAERAGKRPLGHTRSLSTPAAGEYDGSGPAPRSKSGRPMSMVDSGTDTSEFFKDPNTEANARLRGVISPNETNNNKNIKNKTPAPLTVDIHPEVEIKARKAENVNAAAPQSLYGRSPQSPVDLSITSGYGNRGDLSPGKENKISLKNHLQTKNMTNGSPKRVNGDIRKTEIAVECQMKVKQDMKGSPQDRLSPRATEGSPGDRLSPRATVAPINMNGSMQVGARTEQRSKTTPPTMSSRVAAPSPTISEVSYQGTGPYKVTTYIVDGEEELTIGNVPSPTRPHSAPVVPSSRPRHFACIEPVGQPVVGHPPRITTIEPVLVRPASQQAHSVHSTRSSTPSSERLDDGPAPDTLTAIMSVTVTSATMPELQKPQVTTVTSDDQKQTPSPVKSDEQVIVPQTEVVVEAKKELPTEATDGPVEISMTSTKSSSPVVSNLSSPVPESVKSKNRFVFPSLARDESIEISTDDSEDDEERGVYDASFRNSGWIYIGGNQELQMITGPMMQQQQQQQQQKGKQQASGKAKAQIEPKPSYKKSSKKNKATEKKINGDHTDGADNDEAFSREDPTRESSGTTASEEEFKKQYQSVSLRRIQRKQSIMDYQRLSLIAREREVIIEKENNLFGFRIQYSKPVVVTDIDQGGAAEKAGLKAGDMVLKVNGKDVTQATHSQVVKMAAAGPEKLVLLVGTNVCNTLNLEAVKPVMTGYLWKQGGSSVFSNWRKRWFVLKHDNVLYYYKTKEDAEPLGAIVLCNYTVVKARDVNRPNAFKLTKHKARTYFMYSQAAEEMNSWAKAITEASRPNSKTDIWLDISTHNVSIPALSIKFPDCHGVLTKMGGRRKTWKRRYCVLKDACLYYYKDIDAPQALGVAHFHGYSIQETEIGSKKYAFILKPPEDKLRTFYFIADHETDRKRWVAAFAYSIGRWIQTNTGDDSDEEGNEMLI